jgi:hypothetical protein
MSARGFGGLSMGRAETIVSSPQKIQSGTRMAQSRPGAAGVRAAKSTTTMHRAAAHLRA